jgi:hypothetical protein
MTATGRALGAAPVQALAIICRRRLKNNALRNPAGVRPFRRPANCCRHDARTVQGELLDCAANRDLPIASARRLTVMRAIQFSSMQPALAVSVAAAVALLGSLPGRADAPAASAPAPDKQICRKQFVIGSRIPLLVCRTQAEIDAERVATQNELRSRPPTNSKRGT